MHSMSSRDCLLSTYWTNSNVILVYLLSCLANNGFHFECEFSIENINNVIVKESYLYDTVPGLHYRGRGIAHRLLSLNICRASFIIQSRPEECVKS